MAKIIKGSRPKINERFGIGEWYGELLTGMTPIRRKQVAQIALQHYERTSDQRKKQTKDGTDPTPVCPFTINADGTRPKCWKAGGVCSLRLYECKDTKGPCKPTSGVRGILRAVCPNRINQDNRVFELVGTTILDCSKPEFFTNVPFLTASELRANGDKVSEQDRKRPVGKIDAVLVKPGTSPMVWCALEIQSVYFSGERMDLLFKHYESWPHSSLPFPDRNRAPDYRSSGPKRLMPQLQTKVPTLRRWGKKMAVVVDEGFWSRLASMERVKHVSNCDIAWFVIGYDEAATPSQLTLKDICFTTLESAVTGLTAGVPLSLEEFESKINEKRSLPPEATKLELPTPDFDQ